MIPSYSQTREEKFPLGANIRLPLPLLAVLDSFLLFSCPFSDMSTGGFY
jgi:hypothetical protein